MARCESHFGVSGKDVKEEKIWRNTRHTNTNIVAWLLAKSNLFLGGREWTMKNHHYHHPQRFSLQRKKILGDQRRKWRKFPEHLRARKSSFSSSELFCRTSSSSWIFVYIVSYPILSSIFCKFARRHAYNERTLKNFVWTGNFLAEIIVARLIVDAKNEKFKNYF